jgi:hypothetical protein
VTYIKTIAAIIILFGSTNASLASNVIECASQSGDYSDNAYDADSTACHKTPQWQRLGSKWSKDYSNNPNSSKKSLTESNSSTNDGVSWLTSSDDGATWLENGELVAGDQVQFQFDVTRAVTGNHQYDLLKSWVDWENDGWDEDDVIINERWYKNVDSDGVVQTEDALLNKTTDGNENSWNNDLNAWNSDDTGATFFSTAYIIPETLTEILIRARVVCENSLAKYSDNYNLMSWGYQDQGEVEDYQLSVASKKPNPIPEPSTLLIFAIGLITLASKRKRV